MGQTDVFDNHYLAISAIVTGGFQFLLFLIAYFYLVDRVADKAATANVLILALLTFFLARNWYTRQIVATALVVAWALRLGIYLSYRLEKRGGNDGRLDPMRGRLFPLFSFFLTQAIWVFAISLPVIFINAYDFDPDIGALDIVGWSLWGLGFLIQVIADHQKHVHHQREPLTPTFISTGLWKYSRHPNYFGEILMWIGMFLTAAQAVRHPLNDNIGYISVLSPVITFITIMFLTGIPPAEHKYNQLFYNNPNYLRYKETTSVLIPMLPSIWRVLPRFMKIVLFDYPLYWRYLTANQANNHGHVAVVKQTGAPHDPTPAASHFKQNDVPRNINRV